MIYKPHASGVGDVPANAAAAAGYVVLLFFWTLSFPLLALLFLCERKSGLVRFHAMQGMLLWLVRTFLGGGIAYEGFASVLTGNLAYMLGPVGWESAPQVIMLRFLIELLLIVLTVLALVHAVRWQEWRVPLLGQLAQLFCAISRSPAYTGWEENLPALCVLAEPASCRRTVALRLAEITAEQQLRQKCALQSKCGEKKAQRGQRLSERAAPSCAFVRHIFNQIQAVSLDEKQKDFTEQRGNEHTSQ